MIRCLRALSFHAALWAVLVVGGCSSGGPSADVGPPSSDARAAEDAAVSNSDAGLATQDADSADAEGADVSDATPTNPDATPTNPDAAPANPDAAPANSDAAAPDAAPVDAGPAAAMTITSPSIAAGMLFPALHTCDGRDLQPRLDFAGVPAGAQSLAVVLIDDTIDFVHWVAIDIPPATAGFDEADSDMRLLPAPTREIPAYGTQYQGPCPSPRDPAHTYTFRLYALSVAQTTYRWRGRQFNSAILMAAFGANTLAEARLTGAYDR